jgi:altronate hydrolase
MTGADAIRLHPDDGVAVALRDIAAGEPGRWTGGGSSGEIVALDPIRLGHKLGLRAIAKGEAVVKYGARIGIATADIAPGRHVHLHNLASARARSGA